MISPAAQSGRRCLVAKASVSLYSQYAHTCVNRYMSALEYRTLKTLSFTMCNVLNNTVNAIFYNQLVAIPVLRATTHLTTCLPIYCRLQKVADHSPTRIVRSTGIPYCTTATHLKPAGCAKQTLETCVKRDRCTPNACPCYHLELEIKGCLHTSA